MYKLKVQTIGIKKTLFSYELSIFPFGKWTSFIGILLGCSSDDWEISVPELQLGTFYLKLSDKFLPPLVNFSWGLESFYQTVHLNDF